MYNYYGAKSLGEETYELSSTVLVLAKKINELITKFKGVNITKEYQDTIKELVDKYNKLLKECNEKDNSVNTDDLNKKLTSLEKEIDNILAKMRDINDKNNKLSNDNNTLSKENTDLSDKNKLLKSELDDLNNKINKLTEDANKTEDYIQKIKKNLEETENENNVSINKLTEMMAIIDKYEKDIIDIQKQINNLSSQINDNYNNTKKQDLENKLDDISTNLDRLKNKLQGINTETDSSTQPQSSSTQPEPSQLQPDLESSAQSSPRQDPDSAVSPQPSPRQEQEPEPSPRQDPDSAVSTQPSLLSFEQPKDGKLLAGENKDIKVHNVVIKEEIKTPIDGYSIVMPSGNVTYTQEAINDLFNGLKYKVELIKKFLKFNDKDLSNRIQFEQILRVMTINDLPTAAETFNKLKPFDEEKKNNINYDKNKDLIMCHVLLDIFNSIIEEDLRMPRCIVVCRKAKEDMADFEFNGYTNNLSYRYKKKPEDNEYYKENFDNIYEYFSKYKPRKSTFSTPCNDKLPPIRYVKDTDKSTPKDDVECGLTFKETVSFIRDGRTVCFLGFGNSGAGKSYTFFGTPPKEVDKVIIQKEGLLLQLLEQCVSKYNAQIKISHISEIGTVISNEQITQNELLKNTEYFKNPFGFLYKMHNIVDETLFDNVYKEEWDKAKPVLKERYYTGFSGLEISSKYKGEMPDFIKAIKHSLKTNGGYKLCKESYILIKDTFDINKKNISKSKRVNVNDTSIKTEKLLMVKFFNTYKEFFENLYKRNIQNMIENLKWFEQGDVYDIYKENIKLLPISINHEQEQEQEQEQEEQEQEQEQDPEISQEKQNNLNALRNKQIKEKNERLKQEMETKKNILEQHKVIINSIEDINKMFIEKRTSSWKSTLLSLVDLITEYRKKNKKILKTPFNPESSRSHLVYRFEITIGKKTGALIMIDLAGAESTYKIMKNSYNNLMKNGASGYTTADITKKNPQPFTFFERKNADSFKEFDDFYTHFKETEDSYLNIKNENPLNKILTNTVDLSTQTNDLGNDLFKEIVLFPVKLQNEYDYNTKISANIFTPNNIQHNISDFTNLKLFVQEMTLLLCQGFGFINPSLKVLREFLLFKTIERYMINNKDLPQIKTYLQNCQDYFNHKSVKQLKILDYITELSNLTLDDSDRISSVLDAGDKRLSTKFIIASSLREDENDPRMITNAFPIHLKSNGGNYSYFKGINDLFKLLHPQKGRGEKSQLKFGSSDSSNQDSYLTMIIMMIMMLCLLIIILIMLILFIHCYHYIKKKYHDN